MVLAPQSIPTKASSTLSIGRYRTVFWGTVTCSRSGAKKHRRRRYSPRAQRLARPVWRRVDFDMAHSFQEGDIICRETLERKYTLYRRAFRSPCSSNECPASWRENLAASSGDVATVVGTTAKPRYETGLPMDCGCRLCYHYFAFSKGCDRCERSHRLRPQG